MIIIEPAILDQDNLDNLEASGWGLCHMQMPDYMKKQTVPKVVWYDIGFSELSLTFKYTLSHSKLFVWNMTQYDTVLWLDSDTLVADSLHRIFRRADGW